MKKLIAIAAVAAATLVSACNITLTPEQLAAAEQALVADATSVCGFEPTIASAGFLIISALIPSAAGIDAVVKGLADAVCKAELAAVAANPPAAGQRKMAAAPVVVNGVTIEGHFVR